MVADHLLNVNPKQFIIPECKEVAYILGLLWADGYIDKKTQHGIKLQILSSDAIYIIPIFLYTGRWNIIPIDRKPFQPSTLIATGAQKFHMFLTDSDYTNKSLMSPSKILSIIPSRLHHYFWHGLFDGDGCIYLNPRYYTTQIVLSGSYNQDWTDLIQLLNKFSIKHHYNQSHNKCGSSSRIRICAKEDFIKFTNYIYQDLSLVGFPRKYLLAHEINPEI